MKFGFVKIIFLVLVEVLFVKSECDTYSGFLQQIHDSIFGSFFNFNDRESHVGDIEIPEFENVNIDSDNITDGILKKVAGFLEELVGDFDLNSQFNVFHNIDNITSIFVKTFNISDDFEDFDGVNIKLENKTDINHLSEIKNVTSTEPNIDLSTKVHANSLTPKSTVKPDNIRYPVLDINELSKRVKENEIIDTDSYYDINDNSTDYPIIDYIDLYKDTTNEYTEIKSTTVSTYQINGNENKNIQTPSNNRVYTKECTNATEAADAVFPWVTAIFIKNKTTNQFDYYCDGALLSDTIIITAASCIRKPNATAENLLVILGKRSLRVMAENEIISKIKDVHIYDNYTGTEQNVALLVMNVPVTLSDRIEPASLGDGGDESATTGWAISGELTLISFKMEKDCNNDLTLNTFCAVYGNDVTVCPSYGGVYVTRQSNVWFLRGIRADEPMNNSFCVDRRIVYTDLQYYSDWINLYVK